MRPPLLPDPRRPTYPFSGFLVVGATFAVLWRFGLWEAVLVYLGLPVVVRSAIGLWRTKDPAWSPEPPIAAPRILPTRLQLQGHAWEVVSDAMGLLVSAKLISAVSLSFRGLVIAVIVMATPAIALGQTLDTINGRKRPGYLARWSVVFLLLMAWLIAAVPVADLATRGFNAGGFWPTVGTILIVFVTAQLIGWSQRLSARLLG